MHAAGKLLLSGLALLAACGDPGPLPADAGPELSVEAGPEAGPDTGLPDRPSPACLPPLPDAGPAPDGCPVALPAQPDRLDQALALLELDRCAVIFSEADRSILPASIWKDPYRLPFYDRVHQAALRAPPFTRELSAALDAAAAGPRPVSSALMLAAHLAGHGGEVCLPPLPAEPEPLAAAARRLLEATGGKIDQAALRQQASAVPLELQRALAPIVEAISAAARARDEALLGADLGPAPGASLGFLFGAAASLAVPMKAGYQLDPKLSWVQHLLQGGSAGFQAKVLYQAAVRLALAVERAELGRFQGSSVAFNLDTPIGRILLRGAGADTYDPGDPEVGPAIALLLDTGGDDVYRIPAGATASERNPVSVLIDLAGRDRYGYPIQASPYDGPRLPSDAEGRYAGTAPDQGYGPISRSSVSRQGAGRLGIGLLFDLGSEADEYTSLRMSQGFGALGVGVLHDAGGDDIYRGEAAVQGSGIFGIGLLLDRSGDDSYQSYHQSQGFAYVKGMGFLHDGAGHDSYRCDVGKPSLGGDPLYFTPQLPGQGNSSFCQGAGFGRRAGGSDNVYMSGGLGVLRDGGGDDSYLASVFGQATGYWFGTGVLADAGGQDRYDGLWYVQGAGAHFALAVFLDDQGNDLYNQQVTPASTSIGVGHDFSVAWHLDLGGQDSYRAPNLSLGSGNDNGIGLLINLGGDDSYQAVGGSSFGAAPLGAESAAGPRAKVINLGVFIDAGGSDSYAVDGASLNRESSSWIYQSPYPGTRQLGVGLDGPGTVALP